MDFNFEEKDAFETKRRLDEAKARLVEEKRKLKEEMRAARMHGISSRDPILKPWMIWDITIFILMIILFSVAMYYPRSSTSEITTATVVNTTTQQTTVPAVTGLSTLIVENVSGDVIAPTNKTEENTIEGPPPRYSLTLENEQGNPVEEIKTSDDNLQYKVVIKNLETEFIICNADRTIGTDVDELVYKNLKIHPFELEELPTSLFGAKGQRIEVKFEVSCRFETGTRTSKVSAEFDAVFE